jgi:membrane protein implicated in regulation of membrane protease activity
MFEFLAGPGFQPFTIAGLVLVGLCAVEAVSLMFGHSFSGLVDSALQLDHPEVEAHVEHGSVLDLHAEPQGGSTLFGTCYDWLNAGRVPLLVLLMAGLGAFAVVGLVLQIVASHVATPLPTPVAALLAFIAVIPTTRWVSRLLASVLPRDESYAIEQADLIGRIGVVTLGPVEAESAGRAKVADRFGNAHFPRVRAARPDLVIQQGTAILVVDRVAGELTVVPAESRALETRV